MDAAGPKPRFELKWIFNTIFSNERVASYLVSKDPHPPTQLNKDLMNRSLLVYSLVISDPGAAALVLQRSDGSVAPSNRSKEPSGSSQTEPIVYVCHHMDGDIGFMTETDARTPISYLERVSPLVPGLRRLVCMKVKIPTMENAHILATYYWMEDGKSSMVILVYTHEPVVYSEKYSLLLNRYPDHRYPRHSDVLETFIAFEEFICPYCFVGRGLIDCECPKSMKRRLIPPLPPKNERNPWALQAWSWGVHEAKSKKYTLLLRNVARNASCTVRSFHHTASFNDSQGKATGFDVYLETLRSYFDQKMIAWGNLSSPQTGEQNWLSTRPDFPPQNDTKHLQSSRPSARIEVLDEQGRAIASTSVLDDDLGNRNKRKEEILPQPSCEERTDASLTSRQYKRRRMGMSIQDLCHSPAEQEQKIQLEQEASLTIVANPSLVRFRPLLEAQRPLHTSSWASNRMEEDGGTIPPSIQECNLLQLPGETMAQKSSIAQLDQQHVREHHSQEEPEKSEPGHEQEQQEAAVNISEPDNAAIQDFLKDVDTKSWPPGHIQSCRFCATSYRRKYDMKRHVQSIHLSLRPFACPQCPMTFTRKSHLQVHVNGFHNRSNGIKCNYCNQYFNYESSKYKHINTAHAEEIERDRKRGKP